MTTLSLISILLAMVILTYLVYKKFNITLCTILVCVFVSVLSGLKIGDGAIPAYLEGFAGFVKSNFLLFVLSALFGKLMEVSGAALAIAKLFCRFLGKKGAFFGAMLATSVLAYGGVSVFVIAFTVYPIFLSICRESDIPRYLIPAGICAASVTYAEAFFPGAAQIHNIIPTQFLGTNTMAGATVGCLCGVICMVLDYLYFNYEMKKAAKKGVGFVGDSKINAIIEKLEKEAPVNGWISLIPIAVLLIAMNVLKINVTISMALGVLSCLAIFWNRIPDKLGSANEGILSGNAPLVATSAVNGFGAVMKATVGYQAVINWIMSLNGSNPLLILGLTSTIISGITGSGSGGITFTMNIFTEHFLAQGVNPEIFHRIVTMAGVGLDSLPHNGLIVTTLGICGLTHKEAYKPIFITTLVFTTALLIFACLVGQIFYPPVL